MPPPHASIPQVLPSLKEHRDERLLQELYRRWNNHKLMVRWLSRFFNYLDRRVEGWWCGRGESAGRKEGWWLVGAGRGG